MIVFLQVEFPRTDDRSAGYTLTPLCPEAPADLSSVLYPGLTIGRAEQR